MGNNSTSHNNSNKEYPPDILLCMEKFKFKRSQMNTLTHVFKVTDLDNNGFIDLHEFHEMFDETDSPFLAHLFRTMDVNNDEKLCLAEFIHVVATFALFEKAELLDFAFDAFDSDDDGVIGEGEFKQMVIIMEKSEKKHRDRKGSLGLEYHRTVSQAVHLFDSNGDGVLDRMEFKQIHRTCPRLLWPLFRLQFHIQQATFGLDGWKKHRRLLLDTKKLSWWQKCACFNTSDKRKRKYRYGTRNNKTDDDDDDDANNRRRGSIQEVLQRRETQALIKMTESNESMRGMSLDEVRDTLHAQSSKRLRLKQQGGSTKSNITKRSSGGESLRSIVSNRARNENIIGVRRARTSHRNNNMHREGSAKSFHSHRSHRTYTSHRNSKYRSSNHHKDSDSEHGSIKHLKKRNERRRFKSRNHGAASTTSGHRHRRHRSDHHHHHTKYSKNNAPNPYRNQQYLQLQRGRAIGPIPNAHHRASTVMTGSNNNNNNGYGVGTRYVSRSQQPIAPRFQQQQQQQQQQYIRAPASPLPPPQRQQQAQQPTDYMQKFRKSSLTLQEVGKVVQNLGFLPGQPQQNSG